MPLPRFSLLLRPPVQLSAQMKTQTSGPNNEKPIWCVRLDLHYRFVASIQGVGLKKKSRTQLNNSTNQSLGVTAAICVINQVRLAVPGNIWSVCLDCRHTGKYQIHIWFISTCEGGLILIWQYLNSSTFSKAEEQRKLSLLLLHLHLLLVIFVLLLLLAGIILALQLEPRDLHV